MSEEILSVEGDFTIIDGQEPLLIRNDSPAGVTITMHNSWFYDPKHSNGLWNSSGNKNKLKTN